MKALLLLVFIASCNPTEDLHESCWDRCQKECKNFLQKSACVANCPFKNDHPKDCGGA